MPKVSPLPNYGNQQIRDLIAEFVHNKTDRKMLYLRLIDGCTFSEIAEAVGLDDKTVRTRIHRQEEIVFSHLPG